MADEKVALEVPRAWLDGVPDEPLTLQQIFRVGLYHYRMERALDLYRQGVGSLGYIAEQLHLPKRDLVSEARRQGCEPSYSEQSVREELA